MMSLLHLGEKVESKTDIITANRINRTWKNRAVEWIDEVDARGGHHKIEDFCVEQGGRWQCNLLNKKLRGKVKSLILEKLSLRYMHPLE